MSLFELSLSLSFQNRHRAQRPDIKGAHEEENNRSQTKNKVEPKTGWPTENSIRVALKEYGPQQFTVKYRIDTNPLLIWKSNYD